jgi:hypothetical protein
MLYNSQHALPNSMLHDLGTRRSTIKRIHSQACFSAIIPLISLKTAYRKIKPRVLTGLKPYQLNL